MLRRMLRRLARSSFSTILAFEMNAAGSRIEKAHDRATGRGLTAAGFAHERQRFGLMKVERNVLDRVDRTRLAPKQAAANVETGDEPLHFEDRRLVLGYCSWTLHNLYRLACRCVDYREAAAGHV